MSEIRNRRTGPASGSGGGNKAAVPIGSGGPIRRPVHFDQHPGAQWMASPTVWLAFGFVGFLGLAYILFCDLIMEDLKIMKTQRR